MSPPFNLPRRALLLALAGLALAAPAAPASSDDLRSRMPTSSLAGTSSADPGARPHARTPSDVTSALAQESYYSSYGTPTPAVPPPTDADDGDGIAPLPFALALVAALAIGLAAGSGLHTMQLRRRRAAGLAALAIALLASAVAASSAVASGSTAVRCGQTVTTSLKLKADLVDCPGDGLVIGASGITVDLNGHTVDGVSTSTDCEDRPEQLSQGIANHGGYDRITVGNGTIRQFDAGFSAGPVSEDLPDSMSDSRIHDLVVRDTPFSGIDAGTFRVPSGDARNVFDHNDIAGVPCGVGVDINTGQANRISDNRIEDVGTGVLLCCGEDSDGNVAERNRIRDTFGSGVAVFISGSSRIVGNVITDTGWDAISLIGPSSRDALIAGNVIARSKGAGVFAEDCPDCLRDPAPVLDHVRVVGNRISSVGDGIILVDTDDDVVEGNSINGATGEPDSLGTGVLLDGVSRNVVRANTITGSGGPLEGNAGIMVSVAPDLGPSSRPVDGNLVAGNAVIGQHGDGILVAALASHTTLRGNITNRNERDGIDVLSPSTTLLRNTALRNGAFGIEAAAGVTDGGGNVARGNANQPQCTGVSCG